MLQTFFLEIYQNLSKVEQENFQEIWTKHIEKLLIIFNQINATDKKLHALNRQENSLAANKLVFSPSMIDWEFQW